MTPIATFQFTTGWRISRLLFGTGLACSILGLPIAVWMWMTAVRGQLVVYADRIIQHPLSQLGHRTYPLTKASRVGFYEAPYEDEDSMGTEHIPWVVFATPGYPTRYIRLNGIRNPREIALVIARQSDGKLHPVAPRGWLGNRFEFQDTLDEG